MTLLPHQQLPKVDLPYGTFQDLLKTKTERDPGREFLIFPETDRKFTYGEFHALSVAASEWMKERTGGNGTICILFRNTPEFLAVFFGAVAHGMTVVPINPDLATAEIGFIIENSDAASVFYDPALDGKLAPLKPVMRQLKFVPLSDVAEIPKVDVTAVEARLPKVEPTTPAAIIYTSGTTGHPKGVILSHMNFLVDGKGIAEWFQFGPGTRSLCILPLFHNNGLVVTLSSTLYAGGSIIMVDPKASLRSFWALVQRYHATFTSVMPSILAAILAFGFEGKPGSLTGIISGGQYLPRSLAEKFESRFCIPIFEGFGSTEATSYSSFQAYPAERRKTGSVGRAMPISEMTVVDESGAEVPDGTEGEICIRGANVAIGYHKLPELQASKFRDGWYHSGDYGMRDEDGDYFFRGRRDDLIVKGGEKIYPAEIENVLATHPNVVECAAIGVDDVILGQEICAFARLKEPAQTPEKDLLGYCSRFLARFKQPKRIVIVNQLEDMAELPKGPTKKILHRSLREYYERRLCDSQDPEALKWALGLPGA
ncbi:MAG: acyl--CoA ligase [Bryobacterales bacterium]|nr:acyl--CoA ligase [Bryobacterales bacterium]